MLADPSTQLLAVPGFELDPEDAPSPLKRLIIEPDSDDIGWAHLRTVLADCVLQDLPRPLRRRISSFVEILRVCRIRRALFDLLNPRVLKVDQPQATTRVFNPKSPLSVQIGLEMTIWWIEYVSRLDLARARARQDTRTHRAHWICPECRCEVTSDRDWCNKTRDCPSWAILSACSGLEKGQPLFRATQTRAA